MEQKLTEILEIAKDILKPAGLKGMHVNAIAKAAAQNNRTLSLSEEDFAAKLSGALNQNLNLKTRRPSFAKIEGKKGVHKRGWYRVKVEKTPTAAAQIDPPETDKAFTGAAGEHAVMSELLFWEYNASVMVVDDGIDLIASKDNKYFHVQVKTAAEQDGGRFTFTVKYNSFKEHDSASMFYVFVLRRRLRNEFIIIPSGYLRTLISGGRITQNAVLSITITADPKGVKYLLNGSVDVSPYFGNFGAIIA
jgi:hypothetical protein